MDERENLILEFLKKQYGNAKFENGFIYFIDTNTGNEYKVAVYKTY